MNYVFESDHALLVAIRVPEGTEPGVAFPVDARIDYLVCTLELCVPESANVTVELRTGAASARNPAFDGYRQALPRPMAEAARFEVTGGRLRLAIPLSRRHRARRSLFLPRDQRRAPLRPARKRSRAAATC